MPNSRAGRYGENCARAFSARGYADARAVRKALNHDLGVIKKTVAQLNRNSESLPKTDCGSCGAPTCMAFAEDIV